MTVRRSRQRAGRDCPRWVFVPAALGGVFIVLPLVGDASRRVDWGHFLELVTSESSRAALWLSLRTSAASTVLCVLLGVPMALVLARTSFPGPAAAALAGAAAAGAAAGGRRHRAALHVRPAGPARQHPRGARPADRVLHHRGGDGADLRRAAVPGASASRARCGRRASGTRRSPPRSAPPDDRAAPGHPPAGAARACCPGAVLSFARALGEFGATITFAGSLQGVTRTLPLEIYLQRETDPDAAVALSLVLVVVAVVVIGLDPRPDGARAVSLRRSRPPSPDRGVDVSARRSPTARWSRSSARTGPASPRCSS